MVLIAPSILSADFSSLGKELRRIDKTSADWIHIDIMDGYFVENLTIGPAVVKSIRPITKRIFDVHLMVQEPGIWVDKFSEAGADIITFHLEASRDPIDILKHTHSLRCKAGIAINPGTSIDLVEPFLTKIDLLLLMTVNPGFGGQRFIKETLPKIRKAREMIDSCHHPIFLEVDGGVDLKTAHWLKDAGVDVLVSGSTIFKSKNYEDIIEKLRKA
ncbi:MAG TPA: ribulose-phosphate 3-epimerase [Thermoplasmata archaeon]|mgnify:CR=1 FL=1|nr:ribulose-phosphate 3-epimerase [Thermoplasmata archaeon]